MHCEVLEAYSCAFHKLFGQNPHLAHSFEKSPCILHSDLLSDFLSEGSTGTDEED